MTYKMSRLERQNYKRQHTDAAQAGSGMFVFENNTNGTIMLPRATKSGKKEVEPPNPRVPGSGQFQGDSYYLQLVKQNLLRLIKVLEPENKNLPKAVIEETPYKTVEKVQQGKGLFLFENNTGGTLLLPKPTATGLRAVSAVNPRVKDSGRFQGDSYFLSLVKNNSLKLIKVLRSPEQEEASMAQEKLILDQPATVTSEGVVEHVIAGTQAEVVTEAQDENLQDVLLNENPMDDVEILGN